jgi:hypothetical protein
VFTVDGKVYDGQTGQEYFFEIGPNVDFVTMTAQVNTSKSIIVPSEHCDILYLIEGRIPSTESFDFNASNDQLNNPSWRPRLFFKTIHLSEKKVVLVKNTILPGAYPSRPEPYLYEEVKGIEPKERANCQSLEFNVTPIDEFGKRYLIATDCLTGGIYQMNIDGLNLFHIFKTGDGFTKNTNFLPTAIGRRITEMDAKNVDAKHTRFAYLTYRGKTSTGAVIDDYFIVVPTIKNEELNNRVIDCEYDWKPCATSKC